MNSFSSFTRYISTSSTPQPYKSMSSDQAIKVYMPTVYSYLQSYSALKQVKAEKVEPSITTNQYDGYSRHTLEQTPKILQSTPIQVIGLSKSQSQEDLSIKEYQKVQKKLCKKQKKRKNTRKSYNQGHWTKKEHKLYLQFVSQHQEIMQKSDLKKQQKIFKQMSLLIKTRSASQCRSHHQKFDPFTLNKLISISEEA